MEICYHLLIYLTGLSSSLDLATSSLTTDMESSGLRRGDLVLSSRFLEREREEVVASVGSVLVRHSEITAEAVLRC